MCHLPDEGVKDDKKEDDKEDEAVGHNNKM